MAPPASAALDAEYYAELALKDGCTALGDIAADARHVTSGDDDEVFASSAAKEALAEALKGYGCTDEPEKVRVSPLVVSIVAL